ncbi:3-ketoacyl-ACP reductase [Pseudolabrys sp. Root1462]|uniref:SDR family oxidoreductase n=1 Tax=Pseudolabrys sp. Root1462 TaxID=1736466 RepID=UPI000702DF86|nr:SDR family oxidoreductase [Pseudolabrys sp. Root1462]KQZ00396.1 3-ketoacyl-ACP reductase [Pseudolabrys sp. Root1462]
MTSSRTAIITGAARGIGAAIADRLARDGFAVVINFAKDKASADALTSRITAAGGNAIAVQGDVADSAAMTALFDKAESSFGGIDVLVNNAGILQLAPIADTTDAMFDRHIAVNLKGSFNGMREAAKRLRKGGRIINLSTSVVGTRLETYGAYTATKAAVEVMTFILAREMRGKDITVNAVAPGPVATELFLNGKSPELIDRLSKTNPMERLGQPNDIANVVSFLAGPDGGWVNGQTLRANGGMV